MKYVKLLTSCILVTCALTTHAQWQTSGDHIYNTNVGNVAIGTTNPFYPLTNAKPGADITTFGVSKKVQIMVNGSNENGGGIAVSDDGGFFDWNDGYVTYEPLCCNSGLRVSRCNFIVDNNIGIGTTDTKGYKLAVNGDAIFTKIKVKTYTTWPDYVFHATYRLRPLSEVEQYIQQHHHLPEVPTAADVEKDGLDISDNQAMLLKKIEELTLYLIDQNKKLEKQSRLLEQQQREIEALKKVVSTKL